MSKGKKRFIILFLLFLTAVVLATYQHKKPSVSIQQSTFRKVLSYPFDMLNNLTTTINMTLYEAINTFDENKRLKKELTTALLENQKYSEILQENKRLKEILSLKEYMPNYVATAQVIAKGYNRLLHTIVLDKGRNSGIKKDMAVITTRGLVGKIYSVRDDFSEVLLLRDPNFSVAVRLQTSRKEGVISGTGHQYYILKYIPPEEAIEKNDIALTSGLDGIFPPGLPVGIVSSIKKQRGAFFQHIQIQPLQADTKVEEVVILAHSL